MKINIENRRKAKEAADEHWRQFKTAENLLSNDRVKDYIAKVLEQEIKCADSEERLLTKNNHGCTLVLMVGFSIDPLLQAICAYKPEKIVLLLNSHYGSESETYGTGEKFGEQVTTYIKMLPTRLIKDTPGAEFPDIIRIVLDKFDDGRPKDQPSEVFKKLRKELTPMLRNKEKIVLDITGGKKSMISGAHLFGAFSGIDVSYVDFDEYDAKHLQRPIGYTCRIGVLKPNPYEAFKLREWESLKNLYENYSFRAAGKLLNDLIKGMDEWFKPEDETAAKRLLNVLKIYEFWDNGNYIKALTKYEKIKDSLVREILEDTEKWQLPNAVEVLGCQHQNGKWVHIDGGKPVAVEARDLYNQVEDLGINNGDLTTSLYVDGKRLVTYAEDELAKINRLIIYNEDYRSALLRSAGLNEVLVKSRLVALWMNDWLLVETGAVYNKRSELAAALEVDKGLTKVANVSKMIEILHGKVEGMNWGQGNRNFKIEETNKQNLSKFWESLADDLKKLVKRNDPPTLFDLRNNAIHFCLSVPKSIADAALKISEKNLDDFKANWGSLMLTAIPASVYTETVSWRTLCDACGINFLSTT